MTTVMFHNSPFSSSGHFSYELEVVTEDTVSTPAGRLRYFNFLQYHKNIPPICKLYGTRAPLGLDSAQISTHVKRLYCYIHPDKDPKKEEAYLQDLFQMVREAEEACRASKSGFVVSSSSLGGMHFIISSMKKNQWCQVKSLLMQEEHAGNAILDILSTIVFIHLGDFEAAVRRIPSQLTHVKHVLEKCKERLSSDLLALDVERRIIELISLLDMLRGVRELYENEKLSDWPSSELFDHVTPHRPLVLLKDCFKMKNDLLTYEKYLREAIRCCPSGIQSDNFYSEKQQLVAELTEHLKCHYPCEDTPVFLFIHKEMERLAPLACRKFIFDLQTTTLTEQNKEEIARLIDLFILENDTRYLNQLIDVLQKMCQKSVVGSGITTLLDCLSTKAGQAFNNLISHSKQTKDIIEQWVSRLQGWVYYQQNDKERAAHYFSKGQDFISFGCTLASMGRYAEALKAWSPYATTESTRYIFLVMNFCDTLCLPEDATCDRGQLGAVDDMQLGVLRSFLLT